MRFANKLQFGGKTHEVSMTALRIVQRMKKDSLHSGRRPTGLCGAALLIAARMHEFSRTIVDIISIVKIHESTLRKRLTEFADTPSSALTLDEFMTVDLEAEQDPPAFKAARKKDRDRIKDIGEHELTELQKEIETHLEKDLKKTHRYAIRGLTGAAALEEDIDDIEEIETATFIENSNLKAIEECLATTPEISQLVSPANQKIVIDGLKPDIESMCRPTASELQEMEQQKAAAIEGEDAELNLEGLDDEEINNYILTHEEAEYKNNMWNALNAEYLAEMKLKEERLAKERSEGKPEKKKRKPRKKIIGPSSTAGEAIEKMLQEKKISTKINYDILKTLTEGTETTGAAGQEVTTIKEKEGEITTMNGEDVKIAVIIEGEKELKMKSGRNKPSYTVVGPAAKIPKIEAGLPVMEETSAVPKTEAVILDNDDLDEDIDDIEAEAEPENSVEYSSLKDMLNNGEEEDYYGYDDY